MSELSSNFISYLYLKNNPTEKQISKENMLSYNLNISVLQDYLNQFQKSFKKSGIYHLLNFLNKGSYCIHSFLIKFLCPNNSLDDIMEDNPPNTKVEGLCQPSLEIIADIFSIESKFLAQINSIYINHFLDVNIVLVEKIFNEGMTTLAKLNYFYYKVCKESIKQESIMSLVHRISRYSHKIDKISNLLLYPNNHDHTKGLEIMDKMRKSILKIKTGNFNLCSLICSR